MSGNDNLTVKTASTANESVAINFKEQAKAAFNSTAKTVGAIFPHAGGAKGAMAASIAVWGAVSVVSAGIIPVGWVIGYSIGMALAKGLSAQSPKEEKVSAQGEVSDPKNEIVSTERKEAMAKLADLYAKLKDLGIDDQQIKDLLKETFVTVDVSTAFYILSQPDVGGTEQMKSIAEWAEKIYEKEANKPANYGDWENINVTLHENPQPIKRDGIDPRPLT